jgi:two-component system LytT family response regulator
MSIDKNLELRTMIVDDEPDAIVSLTILLNRHCTGVNLVADSSSVDRAITKIKFYKPNLLFLDIEIGHKTGFMLLDNVDIMECQVIFVTAYEQYAIKAFKYNAIDYLLKPIQINELHNALEKAKQNKLTKLITLKSGALKKQFEKEQELDSILIPHNGGHQKLLIDDIIYCEAKGNYTAFYMSNSDVFVSSYPLKKYDEMLSVGKFERLHKSYLVNLSFVKEVFSARKGEVLLMDNQTLPLSVRKRKFFVAKWRKLIFDIE